MSELKSLLSANESDEDDFSKGKDEKLQTRIETNSSWVGGLRQRAKTFHGRFSYSDGSAYRDKIMSNKFAVTSQFVVCSKVLTDTIPSRNCDVLMTLPDSTDDDQVMWLVTRLRARVPELILHLRHHSKTNEYGFYLTASYENLLKGAEELSLKKQVKKQYGGGFKEFVYEDREYFEGAVEEGRSFLKSEERQNIVRHLLINLRAEKGDELGSIKFHEGQAIVPILLSKKLVTQVLPLHSHDDLFFLRNNWVQAFFHKQPLDRVCDYFGVKIALYFAYLGYYTKCLLWPAVIGFVFWFIGGSHQYTDDICFVAFAFFNVIWATLYLEGWKREEAIHAYQWGTMDKEDELLVEPRALFHGEVMKSQVTGRFEPSYPVWKRNMFRYFVSFPVILVCLTLVFVVMWTILELQSYINNKVEDDKIPYFFKFIPKILLAVCITLLDEAYKRIATWLNDMENHRLEVSYENNLIVKLVLFQFVNSFLSLFYIAFYLRDMTQLHEHLAALLITRQVIGNLKETIQPYVVEKIRLFKFWYNLVVSLAPEDLQAQMKKLTSKSKNPKRKKKLTGSEDSGEESGSLLEKTDSMNTLEDLENISEISEGFLDAQEMAVADSKSKVEWAGTGMTIGSIKEEDEECEEEDADDDDRNNGDDDDRNNADDDDRNNADDDDRNNGDDDVDVGLGDDKVATSHNGDDRSGEMDAILEEEDEPPGQVAQPEHDPEKSTLPSFVIDNVADENDGGDDSDDEEEEEDDLPELTIRASRAAVPGGFLGRKRGFGAQRYTGQRKVSMMVDVKSQLPQLKLLSTKRAQKTKMSQAEVESVMKRYEDTYEDYLEMFIQFGYVTLFSSAFPLAALCAFLNNIIEIRSDAFKLCVSLQRPFGQRVETIGIWQKSLELMSIMAVMVNSALIGMSGLAERMFPDWGTVERIVFIVILEHFVLALKLVLAYAIPDVPSQVAEEKARLEFLRREALKKLKRSLRICKR